MCDETQVPLGSETLVAGRSFYDDQRVFERYRRHRESGRLSPNYVMEEPAFLAELGSVEDMRVVDLGCGDASLGRMVLDLGCLSYLGIDASENMAAAARAALKDTDGEVRHGAIEDFSAPPNSFDLVVSCLALHYVEDLLGVLGACSRSLSPVGRILLKVLHPVITSHDARDSSDQPRSNWVVDDYFNRGPRQQNWLGADTTWHHRTIEDYVTALQGAGFRFTTLRECVPREELFEGDIREFARRRRIPLFLLLGGSKE